MWWQRKWVNIIAALAFPALVAACQFTPLYGNHTAATGEHIRAIAVNVEADDPSRRAMAYQLQTDLQNRLNPGNAPPVAAEYTLAISFTYGEGAVAVAPDGTISRYNVILNANLTLARSSDGQVVYRGTATRTGSYNNVSNAFYSAYVSSQDAVKRTISALAEDVQLRMVGLFSHPEPPKPLAVQPKPGELPPKPPALPSTDPLWPRRM